MTPLGRLARHRSAHIGLVLVGAIVMLSALGPLILRGDPIRPDFDHGFGPFGTPSAPSSYHWLGTDTVFRDLLARLALGGRLSLGIALGATILTTTIGATVGILSGWLQGTRVSLARVGDVLGGILAAAALVTRLSGGTGVPAFTWAWHLWVAGSLLRLSPVRLTIDLDDVFMRLVDVLLSFPYLLLLMALSAALEQTTFFTIIAVLGLTGWSGTARLVRGKVLSLRELEFVQAARALGQNTPAILVRHVLPNLTSLLVVLATNAVAGMIVAEAALSFLGLSLPPPTPSWGRMLDEGRPYYASAPWMLLAPASAMVAAVLGFNLLGEGLRDALDPKDA